MPERDNNNNENNKEKKKYTINSGRQIKGKRRKRRRVENGEEERYSDSEEEDDNKLTGKCWGLIVQVILYITNCILWIMAVCAAGFALVIGLETNTISCSDPNVLDWTISTPATVFLFYSGPMLAVATFGCFAIVSANFVAVIIYVILLLLLTVFDALFGISIMGNRDAYDNFIQHLFNSIQHYGSSETKYVGILPINVTTYWNHLQKRGQCCGLFSYMDWQNTSLARTTHSIPDSCCNDFYDYEGCGQLMWKHPDHELHTLESIIYPRGCLSIFPWFIQNDEEENIHILGIFILIFIIIGIIGGIILFIFVISRFFRTPTGLNNPEFPDVPADPTLHTGRNDKVHPEDGPDSRGDRDNEDGRHTERKISFESGPTLIPEKERSTTNEKRRSSGQKEVIYIRKSSGAREESPTRQQRRSSSHKDTSPPRQDRRASAQRKRSPPRQVRRLSIQKDRSPPSYTTTRNSSLTSKDARNSTVYNLE